MSSTASVIEMLAPVKITGAVATLFTADGHDAFLDLDRGLSRAVVRTAGPIDQRLLAVLAEAVDPPVGALTRDALGLGRMRHGPPFIDDPLDEQLSTSTTNPECHQPPG